MTITSSDTITVRKVIEAGKENSITAANTHILVSNQGKGTHYNSTAFVGPSGSTDGYIEFSDVNIELEVSTIILMRATDDSLDAGPNALVSEGRTAVNRVELSDVVIIGE